MITFLRSVARRARARFESLALFEYRSGELSIVNKPLIVLHMTDRTLMREFESAISVWGLMGLSNA